MRGVNIENGISAYLLRIYFIDKFLLTNQFNMDNLISYEFMQAMQIIGVFIGLYAIIFGLLIGTDRPKLKKQK